MVTSNQACDVSLLLVMITQAYTGIGCSRLAHTALQATGQSKESSGLNR